jgi:hypothetical protein
MPIQEVLLLAVTRMLGGLCLAGMTTEPDPVTGLRWVRPVPEYGHVLLGDITTAAGQVLRPFDVVEFCLIHPKPNLPHAEDWTVDFVHHRPRIVRRLEGERRSRFLDRYLDQDPSQVLRLKERSLCLVKPAWVKGCFRLDPYSGKFGAHLGFGLDGRRYTGSHAKGGLPVTDLKWRALGKAWLPADGGWVDFDQGDLEARFGITNLYLALGLTRSFRREFWPIVIGVHTEPDFEAEVDYDNL